MYHTILEILLCSQADGLMELAKQLVFPEKCNGRIVQSLPKEKIRYETADILLFDLPTEPLQQLRAACKPGAVLCCYASAEAIAALSDEAFASIDHFFATPLDLRLTRSRLQAVLDTIYLRKELWLYRNYLNTVIDSVPDMIWFKDITGRHLKVNDSFAATVNKTKEDIAGKYHYYIWDIPVEEYQKGEYVCVETEDVVIEARKTCLFMEKVKTRNGMRQFKTYKSPIFGEDGKDIIGTVGVAHDVTDLENISTELDILLRSIPFAVLIANADDEIIHLNKKFEQCFCIQREDLLEKPFPDWAKATFFNGYSTNAEGYSEAATHVAASGEDLILEIHRKTIYDVFRNDVGMLCIFRDVTRERALEQKLLQNLNTDFLTGLFNRRYFYQTILATRNNQTLSLLYVDLDRFKEVNDTYGHSMGDEALLRTAQILQDSFPEALIARLGGDEFIVALLGDCPLATLEQMAQDLLNRMRQVFGASQHFNILTASIGIAQSSDPQMDIDLLLQQSDAALYEAKENGKNRYRFYATV